MSSSSSSSPSDKIVALIKPGKKRDASPVKKSKKNAKKASPSKREGPAKKDKKKSAPKKKQSSKPKAAPKPDSDVKAKRPKASQLRFVKLHKEAVSPKRATKSSAGYDICLPEAASLEKGETRWLPTGLSMSWPAEFHGKIHSRSGWSGKGLQVTTAGVIDADFRGEVKIQLSNNGDGAIIIKPGEAVAQIIFTKHEKLVPREVSTLGKTKRGAGGFGSTDKKEEDKSEEHSE